MGNNIKNIKSTKNVKLDLERYVNTDTGELLSSEIKQELNYKITEEGNYVIITSDDFVVLDSKTVRYLSTELSRTEMHNLLMMTTDLKTPLNLVYNGPRPHTNDTLQKFLGYSSKAMFLKLLKRLIELGVLYQIKGRISNEVRVIYMLNPYIARKRKTIDKEVFEVFQPFLL